MEKILKMNPLLFVLVVILSLLISPFQANATDDTGWGGGGAPTEGGAAGWVGYTGEKWDGIPGTTTEAWEAFLAKQKQIGKFSNISGTINGLTTSNGFKNPDGTTMLLSHSCQRSQHIWIYADTKTHEWYTRAGKNDVNPPVNISSPQSNAWKYFLTLDKSITNWGKRPGPVIVCSGSFQGTTQTKPKPTITLKANSGKFKYDGSPKTVSGSKHIAGVLIKGHVIDAISTRTETEVNSYPVTFQHAKIMFEGKNVTADKYEKIITIDGLLEITKPDVKLPEEQELYRCIPAGGDSVSNIIIENILKVEPVNIPDTAGAFLYPDEISEDTPAKNLMNNPPSVGSTISSWNSWKSSVQAVGNEREIGLEFNDYHMNLLSTYGGVLDILIEHKREELSVEFCQPQTRIKYWVSNPIYDSKGNYIGDAGWYAYTPWQNSGEKLITQVDGSNPVDSLEFSYQVLAVNCNTDEFNQLLGALGGKVAKSTLIPNVGAGMLQTKIEPHNPSNLVLGRTTSGGIIGKTGTSAFYVDGNTCKENGLCTAEKLMSSLNFGHHDAVNNIGKISNEINSPLFTYFNPKENEYAGEVPAGHGMSEGLSGAQNASVDNKALVFFRDNQNRVVRSDLWRLKGANRGFIIDESKPAEGTYVRLFEGGTPDIAITTIQPLHEGLDYPYSQGYIDFDNESNNDWQNNGVAKMTNNPSYTDFYPRAINRFNFKSQWTSDERDPYKLGLTWLYTVTLERNVLTGVTNTSTTFTEDKTYGVEVACQFYNEYSTSRNAVINKQPHVRSYVDSNDIQWNPQESLKVIFSRSISEKRSIVEENQNSQR